MSTSDTDIKALERYVLSDKKLEEALLMLAPGSSTSNFLKLIHHQNQGGVEAIKNDPELEKLMNQLKNQHPSGRDQIVVLRDLFLKLGAAQQEDERNLILGEIKKYCYWNHEHSKPSNLKKIKQNDKSALKEKSADQSEEEELDAELQKIPTEININDVFSKAVLIDNQLVDPYQTNQIHERYYPTLDYSKLNKVINVTNNFENFFNQKLRTVDFKNGSLKQALQNLIRTKAEKNQSVAFIASHYDFQELYDLLKEIKDLRTNDIIFELVKKKFYKAYYENQLSEQSIEEKRATVKSILEFYQGLEKEFGGELLQNEVRALEKSVNFYLNYLNYLEDVYDERLFVETVKNPHLNYHFTMYIHERKYGANHILSFINNMNENSVISKVIEANIEHLVVQKKNAVINEIAPYMNQNWLNTTVAKYQYIHNMPPADTNNSDYQNIVKQLQGRTELELRHTNKSSFTVDEDIVLHLNITNVPKLQVKVFEINTDNYYRKFLTTFASDINLDGLVAKHEEEHKYDKIETHVQHSETFVFGKDYNGKRGLYVIEFMGNGISSRAIVKKGALTLIHKSTIAGHFAFIVDENKKICKGEHTGIYFDNTFYPANDDTGRIIVPFGRRSYSDKAILNHGVFAEITDFGRLDESYTFEASIVMHDESVVMGNVAKILVKPYLILNGKEKADLRLLEDTKITLQTINSIDNITTSKEYDNLKLTDTEEYVLEFQVPANITQVTVTLDTKVNVFSKSEKQTFTKSQVFTIQHHQSDFKFCEVFLRQIEQNHYQYLIVGKNGEPKSYVPVDFVFQHEFVVQQQSKTLRTDKNGIIDIQNTKHITKITATPRNSRIIQSQSKSWTIPKNYKINYPTTELTINQNDTLRIPFQHKNIKSTNLSLLQFSQNGTYIQNQFEKVKIEKTIPQNQFGVQYINISGLASGSYTLNLKHEGVQVRINVVSGDYWNVSSEFIIQKNTMIETANAKYDTLRFDEAQVQTSKEEIKTNEQPDAQNLHHVHVKLGGSFNSEKTRIHAWAFQFYPLDLMQQIVNPLSNTDMINKGTRNFRFAEWNNFYLSNRQLSDENRYIMERKTQEKTVGNFLEKPSLLLKRNFIRDTTFSQENLSQGQEYESKRAEEQQIQHVANLQRRRLVQNSQMPLDKSINGFQNFLSHSVELLSNIPIEADENGDAVANFQLNLSSYSCLLLVAVSEDQSCQVLLPLNTQTIDKRDLSLLNPYNETKNFSEIRRATPCLKYDNFVIDDITSTDMQLVDSLNKVWLVQKELKRMSPTEQQFVDNMLKWSSLSAAQQSKKYSEYCSHELNVFLKIKQPEYFEKTVRPFLMNKMEKMFVDYWLLDIDEAIMRYISPQKQANLNAFEQCLLIQYLVNKGQEDRAHDIAQGLKDRTVEPSIDMMNRIYDLVLNMNSLSSSKGDGSDDVGGLFQQLKDQEKKKKDAEERAENDKRKKKRKANFQKEKKEQTSVAYSMALDDCDEEDSYGVADYKERAMPPPPQAMMMMAAPSRSAKRSYVQGAAGLMKLGSAAPQKKMATMMQHSLKSMPESASALFSAPAYEEVINIRKTQKLTFKELENTKEYAETHYYLIKMRNESTALISANSFWRDLAQHLLKHKSFNGFVSASFTQAVAHLNEVALVLAVTDLPINDESHGFKASQGRGVEIKAASNMLVFLKEIQEAEKNINKDLLVVHRYFEKDKMDREIEEILVNEVYTCQVIITNISNQNISFQALAQIPEGSLPLNNTHYQKSHSFTLNAFTTMQFQFYFYFPKEGHFIHFPTNVSINRIVVAKAPEFTFKVKRVQTKVNLEDFDDILSSGSVPDILRFMKEKNLASSDTKFRFSDIYWLCKDVSFYKECIQILRSKNMFDQTLWSFSTYHHDEQSMKEFFESSQANLIKQLGPQFDSKYLSVNDQEESHDIFNFLDYHPFVNARAHRIGGMDTGTASAANSTSTQRWILNDQLRETYGRFVTHLATKKHINDHDRLQVVSYLLMQERINEAIEQFNKIPEDFTSEYGQAIVQYHYLKAYLDFYINGIKGSLEFKDARNIVQLYKDYPVLHWRKLFTEIGDQLRDIDKAYSKNKVQDEENKLDNMEDTEKENKEKLVKMEPQMDVVIEQKMINIEYVNVEKVTVNYYIIDLEILFSKTPFLTSDIQDFSFVQPFATEERVLNKQLTNFKFGIREDLVEKNLVIEVSSPSSGLKVLKTYYSAVLRVRLIENYGEIKVFIPNSSGQDTPVPKAYVKVYQKKHNGEDKFFKDGYTDLRGRFDYAQLSGTSINDVDKFSVFVSHEKYGSLIKEAKKPSGTKNN